ncbi:putative disease resistance protein RGA4, partial [Zea mays]
AAKLLLTDFVLHFFWSLDFNVVARPDPTRPLCPEGVRPFARVRERLAATLPGAFLGDAIQSRAKNSRPLYKLSVRRLSSQLKISAFVSPRSQNKSTPPFLVHGTSSSSMDWLSSMLGDRPLKSVFTALGLPDKIGGAVIDALCYRGVRLWNVEEEADKLRRTKERIRAVLEDAEQRRFIDHDSVRLWLRELRAVAFDVDALLDRLGTITAVSRLAAAEQSRKRKRLWPSVELGPRQRWELDEKIAKINERLDEINTGRKWYRLQAGDGTRTASQPTQRPRFLESAAHRDERPIGRNEEKEQIVRALVSDSADMAVISIWGTTGIGKTALAQSVYKDPEVQNFFTDKIWVWLSDRCDIRKATKMIIEAVTNQKCELLSLDILQQRLHDHLHKKQFLLVIDNLWAESFQFWEFLRPSLTGGAEGSKVLITTQHEKVSRMISTNLNIHLKGLEDEECWQILKLYAFSGWGSRDQHDLEPIGRSIASNCQGSPLAAKSIGLLLSDTHGDKEQWENILGEMQILGDGENTNSILPSLQISYQHLSYHLKQCFAFCSILPPGVEFEKDELVRLWIADGLVKSNGRERVEMEAGRCFDELLWRSFFETSRSFPDQKFRVPSLMLELAQLVSKHESLTLRPEDSPVVDHPEWIRYTTILCPKDLSYTELDLLPDSVGSCIHLRYLNLRNTLIKTLPGTVCGLFNLQTLDLRDCYWLTDLPAGMSRLVNLRHLSLHIDWDRVTALRSMPSGIDRLQSLQTLSRFVVVSRDGGRCNINELRNLKIRGELCILNLEAATSDGATEANLRGKEYLRELMLNLKRLRVENYPGRRFPPCFENLPSLESLEIVSCPRLTQFSVRMMRSLRNLRIRQCADLAVLPGGLCGLESLRCLETVGAPNLRIGAVDILPRNVLRLAVSGCDSLERWCLEEGAERVQQIPDVIVRMRLKN